jgi:hypothetical protein
MDVYTKNSRTYSDEVPFFNESFLKKKDILCGYQNWKLTFKLKKNHCYHKTGFVRCKVTYDVEDWW